MKLHYFLPLRQSAIMKIEMQEGNESHKLDFSDCDLAIVGTPVDDRGSAALNYISKKSSLQITMAYLPESFQFLVDDLAINAEDLESYFKRYDGKRIALDASTLGFVEIFLSCRIIRNFTLPLATILYVEPSSYRNPRRSQLLHKRDFELSDVIPGYRAIPGATIRLTDKEVQTGVFFLGYEERRIDRALEDYQMIRSDRCCVVFGVPAFTPGWEMDAFANNIRVIRDKNIRGGVHFCGAENPAATVEILEKIYKSLDRNSRERMFVAPIGTKPNGIGVALFVATHLDIGILYDHPVRKLARSLRTARWHLYNVAFNG